MGKALLDFGLQAAQGAVGAGMGMLLGGHNDRRQREQQQALQDMQIKGNKEMIDYQKAADLKMWNDTNYSAQMEHLRKAGLNAGLLYGMSGGGGVTTGGGGAGVSGSQAPSGGGEAQAMAGMGIQMGLLKAQKENIEADTANKQADTANKPLTGANIEANTGLTTVKTDIAKIEQEIASRSKEEAITAIQHNALKIMDEAKIMLAKSNIAESTWETEIEKIQGELIGVLLRNKQIIAQTGMTEEQTKAIGIKIAQEWRELEIKQQNADTQQKQQNLNEWIHNIQDSLKLGADVVTGIVGGILRKGAKITNNRQTNVDVNKHTEINY